MAFKQTPGRGSMPKTGRGIPPTLMSCSPMKQLDFEYTKKHTTAVDKFNKAIESDKGKENYEKGKQISIDPSSGVAKSTPSIHTTKKVGGFLEERDTKGGLVRSVQWNPTSPTGGIEAEKLVKDVERANKIKTSQASKNAGFANLGSGRTTPSTPEQIQSMKNRGRITTR